MSPKWILFLAAVGGFVGVAVGAFGAHGLPDQLKKKEYSSEVIAKKLDQCEIGVRYNIYHSLAMLAIGLATLVRRIKYLGTAVLFFTFGMVLFSGGLYSMSMIDIMGHWSIVPLGGVLLLVGWILVGVAAITYRDR